MTVPSEKQPLVRVSTCESVSGSRINYEPNGERRKETVASDEQASVVTTWSNFWKNFYNPLEIDFKLIIRFFVFVVQT